MFSPVVWLLLIVGAVSWLGSTSEGWDFNADGLLTIRDLWVAAGFVAVLPVLGAMLGIATVVPESVLEFFEFYAAADWMIKGPLSGLIGVVSWLLVLFLLFQAEFFVMQRVSPNGWFQSGPKRGR